MKTVVAVPLAVLLVASQVSAQDATSAEWRIMPGVVFVNYFPSVLVKTSPSEEYRFDGVGFQFITRAFHPDYPDVAFNLSGGINWFGNVKRPPEYRITPTGGTQGIGATLQRKSFRSFPFMVGAEWVFPRSVERAIMLFAGANAGFHFIDGDLDMGQQTKFGFALGVGFVVKVFEFGVRYYSFSDLENLGVHLGLRFKGFPLE